MHGVPTSLLDFTLNPLVGLFFAVEDLEPKSREEPAHLWLLEGSGICENPHEDLNPSYDICGVPYFIPAAVNPRMAAQQGCFVSDPWGRTEDVATPLSERLSEAHPPKVFEIPHEKRAEIQVELNNFGVNYQSVYPDLEGLGKHIAWLARRTGA